MSKQLVRVGIQRIIKDLYLTIVVPRNSFIELIHEVRSVTRLPIGRMQKSLLNYLKLKRY